MILADKIEKFEQQIQHEIFVNVYIAAEHTKHKDILKALKAELKIAKERFAREVKK